MDDVSKVIGIKIEDCNIIDAIIRMAQSLHLEIVAEGIETEAQREAHPPDKRGPSGPHRIAPRCGRQGEDEGGERGDDGLQPLLHLQG